MSRLLLAAGLLLAACDPSSLLIVDVRSRFPEVTHATWTIRASDRRTVAQGEAAIGSASDLLEGVRLVQERLPSDTYAIEVDLLGAGERRRSASKSATLTGRRLTVVTLLVFPGCEDGVRCPAPGDDPRASVCSAGRCVRPDCDEGGEPCPPPCVAATDCPSDGTECRSPRCSTSGSCLAVADDELCAVGEACTVEGTCEAATPPPAPNRIAPLDGAYTGSALAPVVEGRPHPLSPRFAWRAVEGASRYELEVDDDPAFATPEWIETLADVVRTVRALPIATVPPLGRRYFWRVRACARVCSSWSSVGVVEVGRSRFDYDADGYDDVAYGHSTDNYVGTDVGTLVVQYGGVGPAAFARTWKLRNPMHTPPASTGEFLRFGCAVVAIGDVDGDEYPDLAVGSCSADRAVDFQAVYLVRGGPLPTLIGRVRGEATTDVQWPARAGDLDGDGRAELIASAPWYSTSRGFVSVGRIERPATSGEHVDLAPLRAGIFASDVFGSTPASRAQLGRWMVGGADFRGQGRAGIAMLVPGRGSVLIEFDAAASAGRQEITLLDRAFTGDVVAADLDGTGVAAALVAIRPLASDPTEVGQVFSVADGSATPIRVEGDAAGLGAALATGDVDCDGIDDLALGLPGADADRGAMWIASSATGSYRVTRPGIAPGARFGYALGTADVDGDACSEVIVAALSDSSEAGTDVISWGELFVLRGSPDRLRGDAGLAMPHGAQNHFERGKPPAFAR